jgi:hypothetical protein
MKEKYPIIEVRSLNTEWVADNAYKIVLDAFTQNPNINGVFQPQRRASARCGFGFANVDDPSRWGNFGKKK